MVRETPEEQDAIKYNAKDLLYTTKLSTYITGQPGPPESLSRPWRQPK